MKRGIKRKLSPRHEANAATLYRCGWKVLAIAWHYNVDINTIIRTMKRYGIYKPRVTTGQRIVAVAKTSRLELAA